jgi:hypothetical protein
MTKRKIRLRKIKQHGAGHVELDVEPRYVAVRHIRFGDGWLAPGDAVPVEPGRDYGVMVHQGDIAQVIEPGAK